MYLCSRMSSRNAIFGRGKLEVSLGVERQRLTGVSSRLLSHPSSPCPMLSISPRQPIDPLVETEEYWSTSSSYKEEEKKRGRCRGGSIYRREEACKYRRLGSHNIAIDVARLTPTRGSSVLPVFSLTRCLLVRYCPYRHVNQ